MNHDEQNAQHAVEQLEQAWSAAELANDAEALDRLLSEDFVCVGPFGFVIDKQQYLQSRQTGDLKHSAFDWTDVSMHVHEDTVIAVGTQLQRSTYQGNDASGKFRGTQVAVRNGGDWQIASLHYTSITAPPGRPGA